MGRFLIDVNGLTSLGEDPAAGVGDGHRYVVVAEVDCPDQCVRGGWEEQRGRAPDASCGIAPPLGDQALGEKVLYGFGGGAAREPGQSAQVPARDARVVADRAEQLLLCARSTGRWIGKAPWHRDREA